MRFIRVLVLMVVAAAAAMTAGTGSTAQGASLTPLGDLPGGTFSSMANRVSNDGSVVVGTSQSTSGLQSFRWTSAGGMVALPNLPDYTHSARGVNGDGSVVVGRRFAGLGASGEAFRWTS